MKSMTKKFNILALLLALVLLVGCSNNEANTDAAATEPTDADVAVETVEETETVYEGVAPGRNGDIKVAVTLDGDQTIKNIEIVEHEESEGYFEEAFEVIPKTIVEDQTLAVDAVSGSTISSEALLAAVANALEEAGVDLEELNYVAAGPKDPSEVIEVTGREIEGVQTFSYGTQGNTCSNEIKFKVDEENLTVHDLVVINGCDGNARGFASLADGEEIDTVIEKFANIPCHASDGSSCPDQVAKALNEARFILVGERLDVFSDVASAGN